MSASTSRKNDIRIFLTPIYFVGGSCFIDVICMWNSYYVAANQVMWPWNSYYVAANQVMWPWNSYYATANQVMWPWKSYYVAANQVMVLDLSGC
jgi:hypothetical protein